MAMPIKVIIHLPHVVAIQSRYLLIGLKGGRQCQKRKAMKCQVPRYDQPKVPRDWRPHGLAVQALTLPTNHAPQGFLGCSVYHLRAQR